MSVDVARLPKRAPRSDRTVALGRWVAEQAALGRMNFSEIETVYRASGGKAEWPSAAVRISELGVWYRFGKKYKTGALRWIAAWNGRRRPNHSVYGTMTHEMRALL